MDTQPVRISREHLKELKLLQMAWGKPTLDDVLEALIAPRRLEKLKAVGITIARVESK